VVLQTEPDTALILDAGTGLRRFGMLSPWLYRRVDVLLTHLHLDHVQGLGFFMPLYDPEVEVHIWGPQSTTASLHARLQRYLSPPLFPVYLRDLPCKLVVHEVPPDDLELGAFHVTSQRVCHPGVTVGYRISAGGMAFAYIPDHEVALGARVFPLSPDWTSGYEIAADVDLLIHDAQYTDAEYAQHVGWGHSSIQHAVQFAILAQAKRLMLFHHDPAHSDDDLEHHTANAVSLLKPAFPVALAREGETFELATARQPITLD
jgi:phosphoribosyl 1,2-cyclic phosphodiesterase